jgi:S-DNA-T family DNA segregation ATPase FtsK/SpoIIIE
MIYSLITNHSPEEVSIYILDFGSGVLGNFRNAPQVGDFILPSDEDKINNIFKLLTEELEHRKKLFVNYNGDYQSYVSRSNDKVPYVLLFINNYDVFQDSFDFEEVMNSLSRECSKYGIIIIPTINTTGGMRYKLRQNFKSDITLQFNDQDDYSMIVGNTKKLYPADIYGRGLVKQDNIYEFQTAHIFNDEEESDGLSKVIEELNTKYTTRAPKIPVVPETVLISDIADDIKDLSHVPVGINKDTIDIELFNFKDNYVTLVSDNEDSISRDNFIRSLTKVMAKIPNNNLILIDVNNKLASNYENTSYVNSNLDEVINKVCDSMEFQYKTYVDNNYNRDALNNTNPTTVIIDGFSKVLSRINETVKKRYFEALKNVKELGQFCFIYVDRIDNFKKLEYDEWYKKVIQNNYGIWIGNGVADQSLIKTNIGFKKTNNEISDGFGIIIKNTKTNLVKLVSDGENIKVDDES